MQRESVVPKPPWPARLGGLLVGALVLSVLVIWSLATARYGGPDEPAHVLRAAAVARGDILGDPVAGLDPGYRRTVVDASLTTGDPTCYRHDDDIPAACAHPAPTASGLDAAASSAGTYPPTYYALVGFPVRWFGDPANAGWYRIIAAFWCALVVTIAACRVRRMGAGLLIACVTPATWFLFGVVNPNSLEIALALLAWVGVERVRSRPQRLEIRDLVWIAAPISVAIAIRPIAAMAGVAITGATFVIVRHRPPGESAEPGEVGEPADPDASIGRSAWGILAGLPISAIVGVVGWNAWASVDISDQRTAEAVSIVSAIRRSFADSTETWREMVGSLGWLEFSAPWIAHIGWWGMLTWAAVDALRPGDHERTRLRRSWLWVLAVAVIGPIMFEAAFASSVGFIWQGRYSIPTALGLTVLGISSRWASLTERGRMIVAAIAAAVQVVTLWVVLQRYTVGAHGSWRFDRSAWQPPIPALLLLVLDAAAMAGIVLIARGMKSTEPASSADSSRSGSAVGGFGNLAAHDIQR
ncbi:MAG: DUF2142 domain-containing protein [Ilumatobacteraceae bacterium]